MKKGRYPEMEKKKGAGTGHDLQGAAGEKPRLDDRAERKMWLFYMTLFFLPLIALMFPEEALVNFYMLSVVYFVMVYSIAEDYKVLPLVPRQWEVIAGALVVASSFAITELKWMIVAGTRTYGMINFSVLLIGVTIMFFGVSGYRISMLKAVSLGGGAVLVFLALLRFSFALTTLTVLIMGLILMGYGIHRILPIFMPPLIVLTLAFINTGFYQSDELINAATQYLAPFVSQFSTWFTSLFGYNNYAEWNSGRNAWDIIFVGNGFRDSVGVVGNCTGIVGAMFYGVIATAMLLWVYCEWWRKVVIIIGGVMGSFITNLFRVVILILVYWHFDYPRPDHWRLSNLMYVHEYIGDILYIVFITVYWFFAFEYLIPEGSPQKGAQPSIAESVVFAPPKKRRRGISISLTPFPGQKRKKIHRRRRDKYTSKGSGIPEK
jgi:exosortase/archaeosortase family protein